MTTAARLSLTVADRPSLTTARRLIVTAARNGAAGGEGGTYTLFVDAVKAGVVRSDTGRATAAVTLPGPGVHTITAVFEPAGAGRPAVGNAKYVAR